MQRLQISLEEDQYEELIRVARLRGSSLAALIRDAIEITYGGETDEALAAIRRLLADDVLAGRATTLRW